MTDFPDAEVEKPPLTARTQYRIYRYLRPKWSATTCRCYKHEASDRILSRATAEMTRRYFSGIRTSINIACSEHA